MRGDPCCDRERGIRPAVAQGARHRSPDPGVLRRRPDRDRRCGERHQWTRARAAGPSRDVRAGRPGERCRHPHLASVLPGELGGACVRSVAGTGAANPGGVSSHRTEAADHRVSHHGTRKALAMETETFQMTLLTTFATLGLVLAAAGIYGLIAYSVAQRTREFGIRMALGATRLRIVSAVVRQGAVLGLAGVIVGIAAAAVLHAHSSAVYFRREHPGCSDFRGGRASARPGRSGRERGAGASSSSPQPGVGVARRLGRLRLS